MWVFDHGQHSLKGQECAKCLCVDLLCYSVYALVTRVQQHGGCKAAGGGLQQLMLCWQAGSAGVECGVLRCV